MKIKICCNNGANAFSKREEVVDVEDLGLSEEGWKSIDQEEKDKYVWNHIMNSGWIETWHEEVE